MSSIFKRGFIIWRNGVFLSSEHLNDERNFLLSQIRNLQYISKNYVHVELIRLNEVKLSKGILEVLNLKAMFPNMIYIEYDINDPCRMMENGDTSGNIYHIKDELTQYSKIIMEKGLLYYLVIDGEYEIIDSINDSTDGATLAINKMITKLKLVPEHLLSNKISIPIGRVISDESGFVLDKNYIPPMIYIKKEEYLYNLLEQFVKAVRSHLLEIAADFFTNKQNGSAILDKLYAGLKYNSLMPNLLNLESGLMDGVHPRDIFCILQNILGSLSLLQFTHLPGSNKYNHNDIFKSIITLTGNILSIMNSLQQDGDRILFLYNKEDRSFYNSIPEEILVIGNKTYLLLEMEHSSEKDKIIHWIEEARISGDNFLNIIIENRVRGINRKIINTQLFGNNILVVELIIEMEKYINLETKKLHIFNNYNGNYEPISITLCWRTGNLI